MKDKLFRVGIKLRNEVGATTLRYHHFLVAEVNLVQKKKEVTIVHHYGPSFND